MKIMLIFILMLVCARQGHAERGFQHIVDPKHLLQKMDAFVGRPAFEKAFRCGRILVYQMKTCSRYCEPFTCSEVCDPTIKEYKIQIRDCKSDSVNIFNVSNGKEWFKITPESYSKANFVRFFMAAPWKGAPDKSAIGEEIGKNRISLTDLKRESFVLRNGKSIEAVRLFFTYEHYDEALKNYVPSSQSILVPRYEETAGLHLEHRFYETKEPIARVVEIIDL